MSDEGTTIKRNWEKVHGYVTENEVDVRWILKEDGDDRAHGSLRIVSHPDLKPGFLRAFISLVTKRRPKTPEEIAQALDAYKMEETELEIYSIDEHIETFDNTVEDRFQDLEKLFDVKIFK
jgi:hypothetical protein